MTKLVKLMVSSIVALCLISSAAFAEHHSEKNTTTTSKTTMVTLKTTLGDIQIELNAEKAPKTVENFLQYVKEGHYDGVIFHRVISNFMIQGGGFDTGNGTHQRAAFSERTILHQYQRQRLLKLQLRNAKRLGLCGLWQSDQWHRSR